MLVMVPYTTNHAAPKAVRDGYSLIVSRCVPTHRPGMEYCQYLDHEQVDVSAPKTFTSGSHSETQNLRFRQSRGLSKTFTSGSHSDTQHLQAVTTSLGTHICRISVTVTHPVVSALVAACQVRVVNNLGVFQLQSLNLIIRLAWSQLLEMTGA